MPRINWNRNQPIIHHLRDVLPRIFPILTQAGHGLNSSGVGGWIRRRTLNGGFSFHAEGRAADVFLNANDTYELTIGNGLFEMFMNHASELGVDHVIWNGKQWSIHNTTIRRYPSSIHGKGSAHRDHVHIGFTRQGSQLQPVELEVYAEAIVIPENLRSSRAARNSAQITRCAIANCEL